MDEQPTTVEEPSLLIRINRLYREGMSLHELYEATRGIWPLSRRRERARLALAVYRGIVRGVFEIDSWHRAGSTPYDTRAEEDVADERRWEFVGRPASDELQSKYVGRSVASYFTKGNQFPVTYVNC